MQVEKTVTITLRISDEERRWLHNAMQNAITTHETKEEHEIRRSFYEATKPE